MLRWPTSELPICPCGRPTASSDASIDVCGHDAINRSQFGLTACAIALSGVGSRQPKPSRMTRTTGRTAGCRDGGIGFGREQAAAHAAGRVSYHFTFVASRTSHSHVLSAEQLDARTRARDVRSHARLAARAAPDVAREGRRQSRGDAPHQFGECRAGRRAGDQGIRRRTPAESRPHPVVAARRAAASELARYAGRPVVAYCMSGNRSRMAARALARLGFKDVYHLQGGYRAWKDAGLPVEK